ncbi:hypothetical protein [Streptosporangium roseum]|uniref:hypothetical protein n=1 Tax=Streptosporangium roseum TaxID=2001 RepID=UPI0002D26208|nr:hypothetical protein [Streptosporangium roseum]
MAHEFPAALDAPAEEHDRHRVQAVDTCGRLDELTATAGGHAVPGGFLTRPGAR